MSRPRVDESAGSTPTVFPVEEDLATATDDYATRFSGAVGQWMLSVQEDTVRAWTDARPSGRILDVAGAHGQLAVPLARAGREVTVTGSHPDCEAWLRKRSGSLPIAFQEAHSQHLPFPDRAFDICLCIRFLTHSGNEHEVIRELCRVSARTVILDYPTWSSVNRLSKPFFRLKKSVERNTRPYRLFQDREIEDAFARHGFQLRDTRRQFFWPMALFRLMRSRFLARGFESLAAGVGATRRWGSPVLVLAERISSDARG